MASKITGKRCNNQTIVQNKREQGMGTYDRKI